MIKGLCAQIYSMQKNESTAKSAYIFHTHIHIHQHNRQMRGSILWNFCRLAYLSPVVGVRPVASQRWGPRGLPFQNLHVSGRHKNDIRTVPLSGTLACAALPYCGCGLSCLVGFNSELYRFCDSPHDLNTFWARGLSWIKLEWGISQTNADSLWNPVYNAFHRIIWCGNETIRQ